MPKSKFLGRCADGHVNVLTGESQQPCQWAKVDGKWVSPSRKKEGVTCGKKMKEWALKEAG